VDGGPAGNLYVFIHVEPHEFFHRDNTNVFCRIPISFVQAALGDKITVPTLQGEKTIEIPRGTQPGDVLRLDGKGIPSLTNGIRGDQIVEIVVNIPTRLTKKQESLLKEFSKTEAIKHLSKSNKKPERGPERGKQKTHR